MSADNGTLLLSYTTIAQQYIKNIPVCVFSLRFYHNFVICYEFFAICGDIRFEIYIHVCWITNWLT